MTDRIFLTRAEVAELTGAHLKRTQVSVLVRNGIRHTINAAGWPMVTRYAVEGRAGTQEEQAATRKKWIPTKAA
jgi:hypothetical protein